jgi:uncharacterized integral membrane protein
LKPNPVVSEEFGAPEYPEGIPVTSDIFASGADQSGRTERIRMNDRTTLPPTNDASSRPAGPSTRPARQARKPAAATLVPLTRAASAWTAICVAGLIAVGLIVFLAQNTGTVVPITFLWMHVQASLTVSLLIATVGGILLTAVLGMTRIIQLRHLIRYPKQ